MKKEERLYGCGCKKTQATVTTTTTNVNTSTPPAQPIEDVLTVPTIEQVLTT